MADIKLFYFPIRGRGEFIRLLLKAANQPYDETIISRESWFNDPEAKKATPYGQVPYMFYKGKRYGQSKAIATFFAKKFGFYGKTPEDGLRVDEVMQLGDDFRPNLRDWFLAKDEASKAEFAQKMKDESIPRYLGYFEELLVDNGATGFFVGDSVSLADFFIFDIVETMVAVDSEALGAFPSIQKLFDNVKAVPAIRDYLASRNPTPI